MTAEEFQDFDSMAHASLSTVGTLESLHASFNSSLPTITSIDALHNSSSSDDGDDDSFGFTTTITRTTTTRTIANGDKAVRWAESNDEQEYISRYDMTFEEAQRTWILSNERAKMMDQHQVDAKREKEGLPEEELCAFRGLDALHEERARRMQGAIASCVRAVLEEQDKLRAISDRADPAQLALVSARFSGVSRQTALQRADGDLREAEQVPHHTYFQESSFCKLAAPMPQTEPSHHFAGSRPATTNHFEKYAISQNTRVLMRGGLV